MKYTTSLLFGLVVLLSQAFVAWAFPLSTAHKRSFPPFEARYSRVYFIKPESWDKSALRAYVYNESDTVHLDSDISQWPGKNMTNGVPFYPEGEERDYYTVTIPYGQYNQSHIIFSDGTHQAPGVLQEGFDLIINGVYDETGIIGTVNTDNFNGGDVELAYGNYAQIFFHPNNRKNHYGVLEVDVYAHYKIGDDGEWNSIPGEKMLGEPYSGYYTLTLDLGDADEFTVCFTDGKGNWDNNNGQNFKFQKFQSYIIDRYGQEEAPLLN